MSALILGFPNGRRSNWLAPKARGTATVADPVAQVVPAVYPLDFAQWLLARVIAGEIAADLAQRIYDHSQGAA